MGLPERVPDYIIRQAQRRHRRTTVAIKASRNMAAHSALVEDDDNFISADLLLGDGTI